MEQDRDDVNIIHAYGIGFETSFLRLTGWCL
jgi:hypothetical protein